jgi:RNA polymerase sigma-70 factor (ECF subfamily)
VVVNACLDRVRRRRARAADPLPDDLEEHARRGALATADTSRTEGSDPVAAVLDEEQRAAVLRALHTLGPDQRAALVLVDMQGYSVAEAAEVLGCAPGTVKSRCARGRSRLAPLLVGLRLPGEPPPPPVRPTTGSPRGGDHA